MSEYTPNLNLFKYNTSTDGKEVFSISQALNHNWDILDNLGSGRNIGEIVASTIPLTDAGLHLLDGALIQGSGIYSAFVDYIADLYTDNPNASYFAQNGGLPWTQPILSANGTLGGDSFAVSANSEYNSSWQAYMAFDGNYTSSSWVTSGVQNPSWITFYNPVALNVTSLTFTNRHGTTSESFKAGAIYGSNNNSDWTEIKAYTNNVTACLGKWTVNLSNNSNYYKYYKITGTSFTGTNNGFANIAITATQQASSPEEWWQSQVTSYGVCGKFVYDSTNNTVRLPKVTGIIEGTTDVTALGDLVEAGLPNITGWFNSGGVTRGYTTTGAFSASGNRYNGANGNDNYSEAFNFDASLSNPIYGNSDTVQPQAVKVLYYIVIATSTKTNVQVDIDEIATDLNGKADVDLVNCTAGAFENVLTAAQASSKNTIASWVMPNLSSGIGIGSNSSYSAPSAGWLFARISGDWTNYFGNITINGTTVTTFYGYEQGRGTDNVWIPVSKGDSIATGKLTSCTFYPMKGVN